MADTLRLPIEVTPAGRLRTLAQDSPSELAQSVRTLLSTTPGQRAAIPEYGLVELVGMPALDDADIAAALAEWEPRVQGAQIPQIAGALTDGLVVHDIVVQI